MSKKTTSKTEKDSFFVERLIGVHRHKTTISDGKNKVVARGSNPNEAESRASRKWKDKK